MSRWSKLAAAGGLAIAMLPGSAVVAEDSYESPTPENYFLRLLNDSCLAHIRTPADLPGWADGVGFKRQISPQDNTDPAWKWAAPVGLRVYSLTIGRDGFCEIGGRHLDGAYIERALRQMLPFDREEPLIVHFGGRERHGHVFHIIRPPVGYSVATDYGRDRDDDMFIAVSKPFGVIYKTQ